MTGSSGVCTGRVIWKNGDLRSEVRREMATEMTETFTLIVELATALKVRNIEKFSDCWEQILDAHWRFTVNGHEEPVRAFGGIAVPPVCGLRRLRWLACWLCLAVWRGACGWECGQ